jgi:predicted nucleic acid-binding protein
LSYLLDTNIVSEIRKPDADPHVRGWLDSVRGSDLYISVLVVGEIQQGVERLRRRDPEQAAVFEAWLSSLHRDHADRVLPITADVAKEWGRMNVPDPVPVVDGLMAATARTRHLTFVTRNTTDVARTGVHLLNPFDPRTQ